MRAQGTDVVRSHVRGPDMAPISGATVTATGRDRAAAKAVRMDAEGAYSLSLEIDGGPYTVAATMLSFQPQSKPLPPAEAGGRPDLTSGSSPRCSGSPPSSRAPVVRARSVLTEIVPE